MNAHQGDAASLFIPACFWHCLASLLTFLVGLNCITDPDLGHLPAASSPSFFSLSSPPASHTFHRFTSFSLLLNRLFPQKTTDTMAGFYMQYLDSKSYTRQALLSTLAFLRNRKSYTTNLVGCCHEALYFPLWNGLPLHEISTTWRCPASFFFQRSYTRCHLDPPLSTDQTNPGLVIGLRHPYSATTQSGNPSAHVSCFNHNLIRMSTVPRLDAEDSR